MRIWKGKELEHNSNYGNMTLFVESNNPDMSIIKSVLYDNCDVKSVYFGAGEKDVIVWKNIKRIYGIDMLIECTPKNIPPVEFCELFDCIIIRISMPDILDNMQIKIRDDEKVGISKLSQFKFNLLENLVDNKYSSDTMLYDDLGRI